MKTIKVKYVVKDNYGNIKISKEYEWNKEEGIGYEEKILEDMEECTCSLNESNPYCEGDCIMFDEGEVIGIIRSTGLKDKDNKEIYEGDIVEHSNGNNYEVKHGYYKESVNREYVNDNYGWYIGSYSGEFEDFEQIHNSKKVKVIGNIYQDPKLLQGERK